MIGLVDLRRRLAARRPGHQRGAAARRPWPAGPRRRPGLAGGARPDHHDVPRRPGAQPRLRGVRRHVRRRRGGRPDPRRLADRHHLDLVGLDIDGWRLTLLINIPIGLARRLPRAALPRRVRVAPRPARPPRRRHRHPGPARPGLRLQPRRHATAGATPGRIASLIAGVVAARRVRRSSRAASSTRCCRSRVFANRTRAASFVAMFLAPAAMFAMFFFLSQYIQNVMGYSPLKAGVAFLPFCVRHGGRRRHLAPTWSTGSTRASSPASAPAGRGRAVRVLRGCRTTPRLPPRVVPGAATSTDLLPVHRADVVRHGLTFVPLTLTAVHHLRDEDSGIGSGVLNTMQQVGGALGLALAVDRSAHLRRSTRPGLRRARPRAMARPRRSRAASGRSPRARRRVPARRRS